MNERRVQVRSKLVVHVKRVYIAAPFRRVAEPVAGREYGRIRDRSAINMLESIALALSSAGFRTCLPHKERGGWGEVDIPVGDVAEMCFREVAASDIVLAVPGRSRGVHVELGYAAALGKRLVILTQKRETPSQFVHGLRNSTQVVWLVYEHRTDLPRLALEGVLRVDTKDGPPHPARETARPYGAVRAALVDLGSSTIKVSVADVLGHWSRPVWHATSSTVRISEDVCRVGGISPERVGRLISLLGDWSQQFDALGVDVVRTVPGGALRKATNSAYVLEAVSRATGWAVEGVSESEEAMHVFRAVANDFDPEFPGLLAVLNAGGSTVHVAVGSASGDAPRLRTFDVGLTGLSQRLYQDGDPPPKDVYELIRRRLMELMGPLATDNGRRLLLIHTGGELSYLKSAGCPVVWRDYSPAHPWAAGLDDFETFDRRIRTTQLRALYALAPNPADPKWMDGAVASNMVARCAAELLGAEQIVPSDLNVADGMLLEVATWEAKKEVPLTDDDQQRLLLHS